MQELTRTKKIRSIIAASSGNLVEWFDFYIYAFTATYFAHTFSTSDNPVIQLSSKSMPLGFLQQDFLCVL